MKVIELSIIILSYNTKELLRRCLESVVSSQRLVTSEEKKKTPTTNHQSPTTEIIVVDNGSTDGSVELINELFIKRLTNSKNNGFRIRLIRNKENLGYAKGNNIGIREAKGDYVMLLNSDTVVEPGTLESLVNYLESSSKDLAISPMLLLPNRKLQTDYYMHFPNLWQIFLYHNPLLRPIAMKMPFLSSLIAQKPSQNPFTVDQLPGTALMASKTVWDKVGLLDENYHFFFEDVDWCWRASKMGVKLMVVPEAKVIHLGGASWKQKLKKDSSLFYYQFFSSMLLFVKKNYSKLSANIFKWAIITSFFLTLKPLLAWQFIKSNGQQKNFLV